MIRAINTFKIHPSLISWLFVGLEIILLCYEVFRFYTVKNERSNWVAILLLLLLLIWNCTAGALAELMLLVLANTVTLMVTVLLMLLPFVLPRTSVKLPPVPELPVVEASPDDRFLENCRKYNLSPREIDVVLLLAKGMSYKEIADTLHISFSTVDSHTQKCYKKAGVNNKVALLNKLAR